MDPSPPIESGPAESAPRRRPLVWAVASGKGGVGKSVVASSLAIALSRTGAPVVAADLDFGGANLHHVFGVERPGPGLARLLDGSVDDAMDATIPTTVPDVRLISGAQGSLDAANPNYAQKQKLLRRLRALDVAHVVLDLGAGSAFNTLDAFVAADRRVLVVTPERTAIGNAQHFLKAAFFRSLRRVARDPEVRRALADVLERARERGASPRELIEAASDAEPRIAGRLRAAAREFAVELVVNRLARGAVDPGPKFVADCDAKLGATLRHAVSLPEDSSVPDALARAMPVLTAFSRSAFAVAATRWIEGVVEVAPQRDEASAPPTLLRLVRRKAPAPDAPALPAYDGGAPGAYLRRCRELRGLALAELYDTTRIRQLAEIESERRDALPPEPYLSAFVRQVAEHLGIAEPAHFAELYVERAGKAPEATPPARPALRVAPAPADDIDRVVADVLGSLD